MDAVEVEDSEGEEGGYNSGYGEGGPEEAVRQVLVGYHPSRGATDLPESNWQLF